MKLSKIHIREFKSIYNSTKVDIDDVTCLVGKNESGKTAVLQALYRLNPLIETDGTFDVTDDYPRRNMISYERDIETNLRDPSEVIHATYTLDDNDITAVTDIFGTSCFKHKNPTITLSKGYSNELTLKEFDINQETALEHLVTSAELPQGLSTSLLECKSAQAMTEAISAWESTEATTALSHKLLEITQADVSQYIYNNILKQRIPKFLYFDEYYQLKGQDNLNDLLQRVRTNTLQPHDHPLLGLIKLAGLELTELFQPERTQTLIARLEAAANQLTQEVLPYWSQNKHLRMKFDVRPGQPGDPINMTTGTNIWGLIEDTKHTVSTALGTRSRGFVWFFSFVAWYAQLRAEEKDLILLLDEPGLSLHGKAQEDLLRYFEEQLKPHHQLIYTTHSLFMVDAWHFERVRIVQDLSIEEHSEELPEEKMGTQVITEVLDATPDSLFPLLGSLGIEFYQTLFVGPNSLVVEGASDLLYIQTVSSKLETMGRTSLSSKWTITPVGGSGNVPTFVALISAQTHLNVAVLIDFQQKDRQRIENLYKRKLLKKRKVLTFADYTETSEADIEDMFSPELYIELVNRTFNTSIKPSDLPDNHPRILRRLEKFLKENPLPDGASFNHYRPAFYFSTNAKTLGEKLNGHELDRFEKVFATLNGLLTDPKTNRSG